MTRNRGNPPVDVKKGAAFLAEVAANLAVPGGGLAIKGAFAGIDILRKSHERSRLERERKLWTGLLREGVVTADGEVDPKFEQDFASVYQLVLLDEEEAKADYGAALLASIVRGECDPLYRVLFIKILRTLDIGAIHLLKLLAETWEDSRLTAPDLTRKMSRSGLLNQSPPNDEEIRKRISEEYTARISPMWRAIWHARESNASPLLGAYRSALARNGLLPDVGQQQGSRPLSPPSELAFPFLRAIGAQFMPPDSRSDSRWCRITSETRLESKLLVLVRRMEDGKLIVSRAHTGAEFDGTITFSPGKKEKLASFEEYRLLTAIFEPT